MVKAWSEAEDKRLLLAILKTHNIQLDHQAVADEMGEGRTARAIREHIFKIKEKVAASSGPSPAKSSKASRQNSAHKNNNSPSKRAKPEDDAANGNGDDAASSQGWTVIDDAEPSSPTKKQKMKHGIEENIKQETMDGEDMVINGDSA